MVLFFKKKVNSSFRKMYQKRLLCWGLLSLFTFPSNLFPFPIDCFCAFHLSTKFVIFSTPRCVSDLVYTKRPGDVNFLFFAANSHLLYKSGKERKGGRGRGKVEEDFFHVLLPQNCMEGFVCQYYFLWMKLIHWDREWIIMHILFVFHDLWCDVGKKKFLIGNIKRSHLAKSSTESFFAGPRKTKRFRPKGRR